MVFARTFQISPQGILQQITVGGVWWAQEALARPDIAKSYLFLCFPNTMAFRIMKLLQEIWRPYQPSETDLMGMVLESIDQLPLFCFPVFYIWCFWKSHVMPVTGRFQLLGVAMAWWRRQAMAKDVQWIFLFGCAGTGTVFSRNQ